MNDAIRQPARQRGTALVETTICLPLLLLLLIVGGEVTNAFVQHNTLAKAVRDGARHAAGTAINGAKVLDLTTTIINETRNLVVYGNTAGSGDPVLANLTVAAVTVTDLGGSNIEVRAQYAYNGVLGSVIPAFGFGADPSMSMNLRASVQMRAL
jgi:Flp pilus assembly protein TadG